MVGIRLVTTALLICALAASGAQAQSALGSIMGYVKDEQGAVIVGATVVVNGPALLGERSTTTSSLGYYRITNLPPGDYTLAVSKTNYKQFKRTGLQMKAGLNVSVNVELAVGEFEQVIEVTGAPPLLEVENPEKAWNFEGEFFRSLPVSPGRNWNDVMSMVPGAYLSFGSTELVEMHGSAYQSNVPMLDGVNIGSVQSNYLGDAYLPPESISDIQVVAGYSAATSPSGSGARINVVTRTGGDSFNGEATYDMQIPSWNDVNTEDASPTDETIYRPSVSFGGPVMKEKIWFFSNFQYTYSKSGIYRSGLQIANIKAIDPSFEPFDNVSKTSAWNNKLTWQTTKDLQLGFTYLYNTQDVTNSANYYETESGARGQTYGGPMYAANGRWQMSENATLAANFGWKEGGFKTRPQDDTSGPAITWYRTAILSGGRLSGQDLLARTGNIASYNHSEMDRITISADLDYYLEDFYGSHAFRIGAYLQPTIREVQTGYSSNNGFVNEYRVLKDPNNIAAGYNVFFQGYESPTTLIGLKRISRQYDYYAADTWRPTDRLTINFGFKASQAITIDTFDVERQNGWRYGGSIGFTYQLTDDGRNILRGGYSRTAEAIVGIAQYNPYTYRKESRGYYDNNFDGIWDFTTLTAAILTKPADNPASTIDDDLRQPSIDEFSIGFQRQFPWRITVDLGYYHKELSDRLGRIEVNGIYDAQGNLTSLRDYTLGLVYATTNISESKIVYDGIEINLNKDLSNDLRFLIGYSWNHAAYVGEYSPNDPARFLQPETFANNRGIGPLYPYSTQSPDAYSISYYNSGAAPHSIKAAGTWNAPYGIIFAANVVWQQGKWQGAIIKTIPASEVTVPTSITLPNGTQVSNPLATRTRFVYATRSEGQERAPAYTYVNLRLAKSFEIMDYRLEVAANVFNLFNRGELTSWQFNANNSSSTSYGVLSGLQSPRAAQLNIRLMF